MTEEKLVISILSNAVPFHEQGNAVEILAYCSYCNAHERSTIAFLEVLVVSALLSHGRLW
jgi:hypothetical protein